MNHWTVQQKFLAFVVAIIASFGALSAFLLASQATTSTRATSLYESDYRVASIVSEVDGLLTRVDVNILRMIAIGDAASIGGWKAENATRFNKVDQLLASLKSTVDPSMQTTVDKLSDAYGKMRKGMEHQVEAIEGGDVKRGGEINKAEVKDNADRSFAALTELKAAEDGLAARKVEAGLAANAFARTSSIVAAVLVSGGALWFGMTMIRNLVRPIRQGADAARRMAAGDLTVELPARGKDEVGQLLQALSDMQKSLSGIVQGVRSNAESVATASAQIAQGNQDLSQRTDEQASTLQATSASMNALGGTVRQNADNARQANQLALGASTVAIKGGDVVGRVVDTMKGINDSSKRIADIISVIDGIAFQTNILALNAAVEAARAGEQGRGFAVVASEVRSLAQRSAEAAKEIKQLINASVERVDQGTALVDEAGATMTEVVASIRRVTDIMGEIDAASTEQNAGVAQIGSAVTQMDQATQQNAALVEESAAAAESLKVQAQQLVQTVAVFTLATGQGSPAFAATAQVKASFKASASPAAPRPSTAAAAAMPSAARAGTTSRAASAASASASASGSTLASAAVDRRSPNRAKNIVRPSFGATSTGRAAAAPPASASSSPAAAEGTGSDDWTSF